MISEVFSNGQTIEVPLPDLLSVQVSAGKGRAGRATYLPRSEPPLSSFLKKTISRGRVETVTEASPYICLGVGPEESGCPNNEAWIGRLQALPQPNKTKK